MKFYEKKKVLVQIERSADLRGQGRETSSGELGAVTTCGRSRSVI